MSRKHNRDFRLDSILAYFRLEWLPIALITVSGLIYNIGLLAGPWFEGRLAQCLADILGGSETGFRHGGAGGGLHRRNADRAGFAVCEAVLWCAALPTTSTAE